jgi:hypothetical protein
MVAAAHGHVHARDGPSRHTAAADRSGDLLELLSELIDAHTNTVRLITGDEPIEREGLAHCDHLRALQRLGRETLARHDQRIAPPPGPAIVAELTAALALGDEQHVRLAHRCERILARTQGRTCSGKPLSPDVRCPEIRGTTW